MNSDEPSKTRALLILLSVSIPSFMLSLDANIVAVSLPSIAHSLHASFADVEWVISSYTLAFASLLLPAGTLADRYGRKKVLLMGLALFTAASLACGMAVDVLTLNIARAFQGAGAALQLSAALATLSHEFRGPARAKAFAFWGSVIGIAITLGPVVGGIITQQFGWAWAFYINLPVGVGVFALALHAVAESRDPAAETLDVPGAITFAGALFFLTLALISGNHHGWLSRGIFMEFAAAVVLLIAFVLIERRQARPMLELAFFRRPTYIGANIAGLVYAASFYTMLTYLPMYFQGGLGYEPQKVGLLMLPMAVPIFLVPRIISKHLAHRLSGRVLLTAGQVLVALGLLWLGFSARSLSYAAMLTGMLIAGLGAGILNGETAKVAMTVIPAERAGMAAGIGGTVRFSGIVIGFAALGAILFGQILTSLRSFAPEHSLAEATAIAQRIVSGDLTGAASVWHGPPAAVAMSFGLGYQTVFFTAFAFALLSAITSWLLIRAADTSPEPVK